MTAGWVAATTRGRSLLGRTIGTSGAIQLANQPTWSGANEQLRATVYGANLAGGDDRATARRAARLSTAWQLRVLAGWFPPASGSLARMAAAPFEISNIEHHVAHLCGSTASDPIPLGSLGVVWPRLARTTSIEQVRTVLAHSVWGDPGGDQPSAITLGLRVGWARRVVSGVPSAITWAHGALAGQMAAELFCFERSINDHMGRELDRLLGRAWRTAGSVGELYDRLPGTARWVLDGVTTPAEIWKSEIALLGRVAHDAQPAVAGGPPSSATVAAILALLLVDLWRVTAAIEAAGRWPAAAEVLDAVA